ncbi:hypothetical protein CK203_114843 [Vitis vinifera]|uniref:Retrotransposon gag domain-containing protein n=1 Tax=Vitis vinifera TaxID=29760 RepID=A0A438DY52_VITVI|nr:hypothetical protein CK203_114843 [Vitis vinifera]
MRKCMCGGDDHLAWKHLVSLEACRGLRTVGGFHSYTWVHLWTFRPALVTIGFSYHLHSLILADATPLPVIAPIQALEDAHAHMDRLEQRMRQMRVSDGAISWDDFDGAMVASLPSHFRMLEIERTWDDLAQEFLIQFALNTIIDVSRREIEALRQGSEESLVPRPVPQPMPPQFRMDLHCAYHQGPGHDTDRCSAMRHAIQDLID